MKPTDYDDSLVSPLTPKQARLQFAGVFASIGILFYFTSAYVLARCTSAAIGLLLFGLHPFLQANPTLFKYLDIQRTLFLHVPTNAQLSFAELQLNPTLFSTVPEPALKVETTEGTMAPPPLPPRSAAAKMTGFFKTAVDLAEKSSEMATGQQPISLSRLRKVVRGESLPSEDTMGIFSLFPIHRCDVAKSLLSAYRLLCKL